MTDRRTRKIRIAEGHPGAGVVLERWSPDAAAMVASGFAAYVDVSVKSARERLETMDTARLRALFGGGHGPDFNNQDLAALLLPLVESGEITLPEA